MQVLVIHHTESEEVFGMVTPLGKVDFDKFDDEVRRTWKMFDSDEENEDSCIEDFVDYHNENSEMQIDYAVSGFIQL
jgi:hypothetical protein